MAKINWIRVYGPEILPAHDFIGEVKADGKKLCMVKTGDVFFATQPYCPHAGAALAYGQVKNDRLICPYHRYEYDLRTGRGGEGQGDYIDTYPVELRPDGVYVGLPAGNSFFKLLFGS